MFPLALVPEAGFPPPSPAVFSDLQVSRVLQSEPSGRTCFALLPWAFGLQASVRLALLPTVTTGVCEVARCTDGWFSPTTATSPTAQGGHKAWGCEGWGCRMLGVCWRTKPIAQAPTGSLQPRPQAGSLGSGIHWGFSLWGKQHIFILSRYFQSYNSVQGGGLSYKLRNPLENLPGSPFYFAGGGEFFFNVPWVMSGPIGEKKSSTWSVWSLQRPRVTLRPRPSLPLPQWPLCASRLPSTPVDRVTFLSRPLCRSSWAMWGLRAFRKPNWICKAWHQKVIVDVTFVSPHVFAFGVYGRGFGLLLFICYLKGKLHFFFWKERNWLT